MSSIENPRPIRIVHTPHRGSLATDVPAGADEIFAAAGWHRGHGWRVSATPGGQLRQHLVLSTITRLRDAGFEVDLVDEAPSPLRTEEAVQRARRCAAESRARLLGPIEVQRRIDRLASSEERSTSIELEALLQRRADQVAAGERLDLEQRSLALGARVRISAGWGVVRRLNRRWAAVELADGSLCRAEYASILELGRH